MKSLRRMYLVDWHGWLHLSPNLPHPKDGPVHTHRDSSVTVDPIQVHLLEYNATMLKQAIGIAIDIIVHQHLKLRLESAIEEHVRLLIIDHSSFSQSVPAVSRPTLHELPSSTRPVDQKAMKEPTVSFMRRQPMDADQPVSRSPNGMTEMSPGIAPIIFNASSGRATKKGPSSSSRRVPRDHTSRESKRHKKISYSTSAEHRPYRSQAPMHIIDKTRQLLSVEVIAEAAKFRIPGPGGWCSLTPKERREVNWIWHANDLNDPTNPYLKSPNPEQRARDTVKQLAQVLCARRDALIACSKSFAPLV